MTVPYLDTSTQKPSWSSATADESGYHPETGSERLLLLETPFLPQPAALQAREPNRPPGKRRLAGMSASAAATLWDKEWSKLSQWLLERLLKKSSLPLDKWCQEEAEDLEPLLLLPACAAPERATVGVGHVVATATGLAVAISRGLPQDAPDDNVLLVTITLHVLWPTAIYPQAATWRAKVLTALEAKLPGGQALTARVRTVLAALEGGGTQPLEAAIIRLAVMLADSRATGNRKERLARLEALGAALPGVPQVALVILDADRVQSYLLESNRLPDIRGGSHLLVELEQRGVPMLLAQEGLPPEAVLFSGGGRALAVVPAWSEAQLNTLVTRLEDAFLNGVPGTRSEEEVRGTLAATATGAWLKVPLADLVAGPQAEALEGWLARVSKAKGPSAQVLAAYGKDGKAPSLEELGCFGTTMRVLLERLRARKNARTSPPHFPTVLMGETCAACLIRPATHRYVWEAGERELRVCGPCFIRQEAGKGFDEEGTSSRKVHLGLFRRFLEAGAPRPDLDLELASEAEQDGEGAEHGLQSYREYASSRELNWLRPAPTLEEVAGAAQTTKAKGYLGYIYADGNGFGDLMNGVLSPGEVRGLAGGIERTLSHCLFDALERSLKRPAQREANDLEKELGRDINGKLVYHPFELLVLGGDDLMVVVPSDVAYEVACRLARSFEASTAALTIKVGVLLTAQQTPVAQARELVSRLMKHAGKLSRSSLKSAVDFQLLPGDTGDVSDLEALRRALYGVRDVGTEERLEGLTTERPLTLQRAVGLWRCLEAMARFPMSQLMQLRQAALEGPLLRGAAFYQYKWVQAIKRAGQGEKDLVQAGFQRLSQFLAEDPELTLEVAISKTHHPFRKKGKGGGEIYQTALSDLIELRPFVRLGGSEQKQRDTTRDQGKDGQGGEK